MTSACEINNSLTSFTGICLVKADNCVASKQASKQAKRKRGKPVRGVGRHGARAFCVFCLKTEFLSSLSVFRTQKVGF